MYCTQDDVLQYTGVDCSDFDIRRASADVAMIAGLPLVDFDEELYWEEDVEILKLATIFQTVWLMENSVGANGNTDVSSYSQDGESSNLNPTGLVLAPRARMWINNLSWMKSRRLGGSSSKVDYLNTTYGGGWVPHSIPLGG